MANQYATNPVVLDTFTSAVDLVSSMGGVTGSPIKLHSISLTGATAGATALITDKAGGNTVFNETCQTTSVPVTKFYGGAWVPNLCIAANTVSSGKIIVTLG